MRAGFLFFAVVAGTACKSKPANNLELDAIRVTTDARMRTDIVGHDQFASEATFVLVDAENTASTAIGGAYVTLAGELTDDGGATVGTLKPQSLWIPSGERRTFALVDTERKPRPASTSARIKVTGALIPTDAPRVHIEELHTFDDYGKMVAQAYVVNEADRIGKAVVIAAFHGPDGRPMTRPFQAIELDRKQRRTVQFVGPPGSKTATIFVGDVVY